MPPWNYTWIDIPNQRNVVFFSYEVSNKKNNHWETYLQVLGKISWQQKLVFIMFVGDWRVLWCCQELIVYQSFTCGLLKPTSRSEQNFQVEQRNTKPCVHVQGRFIKCSAGWLGYRALLPGSEWVGYRRRRLLTPSGWDGGRSLLPGCFGCRRFLPASSCWHRYRHRRRRRRSKLQ